MNKQLIEWLEEEARLAPTWSERTAYLKVIDKIKSQTKDK